MFYHSDLHFFFFKINIFRNYEHNEILKNFNNDVWKTFKTNPIIVLHIECIILHFIVNAYFYIFFLFTFKNICFPSTICDS